MLEMQLKNIQNLLEGFNDKDVAPGIGYKVATGNIHRLDKLEYYAIVLAILVKRLLFCFVLHYSHPFI